MYARRMGAAEAARVGLLAVLVERVPAVAFGAALRAFDAAGRVVFGAAALRVVRAAGRLLAVFRVVAVLRAAPVFRVVAVLRVVAARLAAGRDAVVRELAGCEAEARVVVRVVAARLVDATRLVDAARLAGAVFAVLFDFGWAARDVAVRLDRVDVALAAFALARFGAAAVLDVRVDLSGALRLAAVAVAFARVAGLARAGALAVDDARPVLAVFAPVAVVADRVTREPVRAAPRVAVVRRPPARIAIAFAIVGPLLVSSLLI